MVVLRQQQQLSQERPKPPSPDMEVVAKLLAANRRLQRQIHHELADVALCKAQIYQFMAVAAKETASTACLNHVDDDDVGNSKDSNANNLNDSDNNNDEEEATTTVNNDLNINTSKNNHHRRRRSTVDPPWRRVYFSCPHVVAISTSHRGRRSQRGPTQQQQQQQQQQRQQRNGLSTPEPNADTILRRCMERQTFLFHLQPPWLDKELQALKAIIVQLEQHPQQQQQQQAVSAAPANASEQAMSIATETTTAMMIDFDHVACVLQRMAVVPASAARFRPRTADECQAQWKRIVTLQQQQHQQKDGIGISKGKKCNQSLAPFSKQEVVVMWEHMHRHGPYPDWYDIANQLNRLPNNDETKQRNDSDRDRDRHTEGSNDQNDSCRRKTRRTALECLAHYQTKLVQQRHQQELQEPMTVWTCLEDELLLKYTAASGPQWVIDGFSLQQPILTDLLPHKTKAAIMVRLNQSLLNPNYHATLWTPTEERQLVILMKIYRDSSTAAGDVFLASTHFPHRSGRAVFDKWQRTLSPVYDTRPFTLEEDALLMHTMRHHATTTSWKAVSDQYFRHRHPQRLWNRWSELATEEDILQRATTTVPFVSATALSQQQVDPVVDDADDVDDSQGGKHHDNNQRAKGDDVIGSLSQPPPSSRTAKQQQQQRQHPKPTARGTKRKATTMMSQPHNHQNNNDMFVLHIETKSKPLPVPKNQYRR